MTFRQGKKWDDLGYVSGSGHEVLCYPLEVAKSLVGSFTEIELSLALGHNRILEVPKNITCSWYVDSHEPQIAKDDVPLLHAGAPLGLGDTVDDFPQPLNTLGWQVDCHTDVVHHLDNNNIDGVPDAVYFAQLPEGDLLVSGWGIVCRQGSKDMVNYME